MSLLKLLSLCHHTYAVRERRASLYCWEAQRRKNQTLPEGDWRIWMIMAGRGFGKTRTGAETIRHWVKAGHYKHICLLGQDLQDVRRVMIEGESGLLRVSSPEEEVRYEPSKRRVIWPNGAIATAYGAQSPEQLRGPQFDAAWVDELAKFPNAEEIWTQLMLGLRLGTLPRVIITTTPRSIPLMHRLIQDTSVHITTGHTFENEKNLAPSYVNHLKTAYPIQDPLRQQEIEGRIVENQNTALWTPNLLKTIHACDPLPSTWDRVVIAVDPAVTSHKKSDRTGIIVAARHQNKGYILKDLSGHYASPKDWILHIAQAFKTYQADRVIAEVNNGGDLIESLLRTYAPFISYRAVRAIHTKKVRAEPIAALYEKNMIIHTQVFPELEKELCQFSLEHTSPRSYKSPDRVDALVWALHELFFSSQRC